MEISKNKGRNNYSSGVLGEAEKDWFLQKLDEEWCKTSLRQEACCEIGFAIPPTALLSCFLPLIFPTCPNLSFFSEAKALFATEVQSNPLT